MAILDPGSRDGLTEAERRRILIEIENDKRQQEIDARQEQSSEGNVRVASAGKRGPRNFIGGGAVVYNSEVNPTDFIPSNSGDANQKLPDYYRNGRKERVTRIIDGEEVTVTEYSPMPEMVGERENPTLSSIRLIDPRKIDSRGPNSNNPRAGQLVPEYSKFFLESVQESHNEKFQLVETFNDWYVYFYGEKPPVYTFSGHLLNFNNYNWKNEFMYFYQNFWRGTKAVALGARVFLTYDYQQIQGYLLGISTNVRAVNDKAAPFNISVLVTRRLFFNGTNDDGVIRDNLIPRSDNGLINTNADVFSRALTAEFLNNQRAAASNDVLIADNQSRGERLLNSSSINPQNVPNAGGINSRSDQPLGAQRATFLKRNLGIS